MIELEARAVEQLIHFMLDDEDLQSQRISRAHLPHAQFILDSSRTVLTTDLGQELGEQVGWRLVQDGRYNEAERPLSRVLEARETLLGLENQLTLRILSNFGHLLLRQGKYAKVEEIIRQALEAQKKVLGLEDRYTLASFHNLGVALEAQGNLEESDAMSWRALEGREKVLGFKPLETLDSLERIGNLLIV